MSNTRVLITGFGPFLDVKDNPSALLTERLKKITPEQCKNLDLKTHIIPTEWQAVRQTFDTLIRTHDPQILLHFGVHRSATKIRIEQQAANCTGTKEDACGVCHETKTIIDSAPDTLTTTLPVHTMIETLNQSGPLAKLSTDAGSYLCNFLYFLSLTHCAQSNGSAQACFIHIPRLERDSAPSLEELETSALNILKMSLNHARY